jgi:hypothetical protein
VIVNVVYVVIKSNKVPTKVIGNTPASNASLALIVNVLASLESTIDKGRATNPAVR